MMEDAKIARLWSNFHRLSDEHRRMILKVTEIIAHPEVTGLETDAGKGFHPPETNTPKARK
jgi:hypothetical protein